MANNELWKILLRNRTIKRGWHLARDDKYKDFAEDLYSGDAFAIDLNLNTKEIVNRIRTDTYRPTPVFPVEVPKGSLGFRPGTVIPIQDRSIISAIVLLIAGDIDKFLPESVYSWRVKKPIPTNGSIFKESRLEDLPYLKKKTIKRFIDPFESWYLNWPEFDTVSRITFEKDKYRYLVTSDIAAYFENIQLPILRDRLLTCVSSEPKVINLLIHFFETWAQRTEDGRPHLRGIPQGNFVSSFLGNIYLLPLDEAFELFKKECDARYYRYMDDIRIFTKDEDHARKAVIIMERTLRKLHLNVQTAKTKIYDEKFKEISNYLLDERIDEINDIRDDIKSKYGYKEIPSGDRKHYLDRLNEISRANPKIIGAKKPLEGLTSRVFRMWINKHNRLESWAYVDRLIKEIQLNPDYRLIRKLITAARKFPRRKSIETKIMKFLESKKNIYPYQEAECIRVLRYLSRISEKTIDRCARNLFNTKARPYLRMQSAYMLSRVVVDENFIKKCFILFNEETNQYVQTAIAAILVQEKKDNAEIVKMLHFHPNDKLREIGKLYRYVKHDIPTAKDRLRHIFNGNTGWDICDNMPFIHLMNLTSNLDIKMLMYGYVKKYRNKIVHVDIREMLKTIYEDMTKEFAKT